MNELTVREKIIDLLSHTNNPLTVYEIITNLNFRMKESEIYEHLKHIAKTIKSRGGELLMRPPTCKVCGYVFKDLDKPRKPTKCPRCKSERIESPAFIIKYKFSTSEALKS